MIPNNLPRLSAGKQDPGSGNVCAEQAISWLVSGRLDLGDETDHPECVQPVLNALAIAVNDTVSDSERGRMWPIILRQPGTAHPEMEPVLSVRLAVYLAEQVLDLVRPDDRQVCRDAIAAAQAWCDNPSEETKNAAYAANAANAANAAYAVYATNAAYATTNAAYAAANAGRDLIALLEGAQAECERLTGHTPSEPDTARLQRLAELVGTRDA